MRLRIKDCRDSSTERNDYVEQALAFFASITKNKKKEEARKQRDEEKVTPEDVAELLADFTFTESIPLGLTDEEREELTNFDKKIS